MIYNRNILLNDVFDTRLDHSVISEHVTKCKKVPTSAKLYKGHVIHQF